MKTGEYTNNRWFEYQSTSSVAAQDWLASPFADPIGLETMRRIAQVWFSHSDAWTGECGSGKAL
ncbi:MAG: hypothetical protein CMJ77_01500 [Planctomycetaceae bacterium]|nr:hypothetical protein [Planctomycetaceae bacterium]